MKFSNADEGAYGIDKVKEMSSSLSFNVPGLWLWHIVKAKTGIFLGTETRPETRSTQ